MGVIYSTNTDTRISSITFSSTGRTAEFTEDESREFKLFLLRIKAEGKLQHQSDKFDNPFRLFTYSDSLRAMSITVTGAVQVIIGELAQNIIDLEITSEYDNLLPLAADRIKSLYSTEVGLSDTSSREAMGEYLQEKLMEAFDAVDHIPMMQDFMNHL